MKVASEAVGAIADRRANSLTAIVQREVERLIVSGEIPAGERLNEQHLATRLGVSRGPVREALRALERAGLVHAVVNLGMFVRQVSQEEAAEMYEMRGLVFGFSCARLAETATAEQKAGLRRLIGKMDEAIAAGDAAGYYRLNLQFHDDIMEYAGHSRANQIYQSLVKEGHLFRRQSLQPVTSMQESNAEHARMVAAIEAGDAEDARRAAEEHHSGGRRRWLAAVEK
jgi:DNA-binding GntR family transcriptional regulator